MGQADDRTFEDLVGAPLREPPGPRRRRRHRCRRLLTAGLMLVAVIGTASAGGRLVLHRATSTWSHRMTRIDSPFTAVPSRPAVDPAAGRALNILVLGSDRRVSADDPGQWAVGGQRTDTIMVVHITSARDGAFVMSIPRDSWVDVPGHGKAKINAAFSWGGPRLMVRTVEQLTGIRLDHFAIVGFEGFRRITDALGGVTITVPKTVSSALQGTVRAGTYTMDGETALTYVRQRYNLPGGDFGRIKRQQNWIRAVVLKLKTVNPVTDPLTFDAALSALSSATEVDEGLTPELIRELAVDLKRMGPHDLRFFTIPVSGTGWSPDHRQSIVVLDPAVDAGLWTAIRRDRIAAWVTVRKPDSLGHTVH